MFVRDWTGTNESHLDEVVIRAYNAEKTECRLPLTSVVSSDIGVLVAGFSSRLTCGLGRGLGFGCWGWDDGGGAINVSQVLRLLHANGAKNITEIRLRIWARETTAGCARLVVQDVCLGMVRVLYNAATKVHYFDVCFSSVDQRFHSLQLVIVSPTPCSS